MVMLGTQDLVQGSDNVVTPVEITLYALIGNPSANTIRVRGTIKNHKVVSLIDLGSTHNFLDTVELDMLNLHLDTSQILEVKVADDSVIKTLGICHGVTLAIRGYKFVMDLNVLHLGGYAVVLGTQWLCTLREISWDFKLLTILYLGNRVLLKGLHFKGFVFLEVNRFFNGFATRKGLVL